MSVDFVIGTLAVVAVLAFIGGAIAYYVAGRQFGRDRGEE